MLKTLYARLVLWLIRPALNRCMAEEASADPQWGPWTPGFPGSVPESGPAEDLVIFEPGKPPVAAAQKSDR